jgi:hypothetical protein
MILRQPFLPGPQFVKQQREHILGWGSVAFHVLRSDVIESSAQN